MMQFLPQGYSFESYSNPYQSQFVSPYYGSGQYGWQYSPMAQYGTRLPTCTPGTCPPWVPPGMVATPSSGVQELSVLFDPTLAARMSRAYNAWTIGVWGKPDVPAWLWPDGGWPRPVPPNVCCEVPPCVSSSPGPGYYPPGTGGSYPPPSSTTPQYLPPTSYQPAPPQVATPVPKTSSLGVFPSGQSTPSPNPGMPARMVRSRRTNPSGPQCQAAGDKGACYKCCYESNKTKSGIQSCLEGCVGLPPPKPESKSWSSVLSAALPSRRQRADNQNVRRFSRTASALRRAESTTRSQIPTVKCDQPCPADSPWAGKPFCCPAPVRNPRRRITSAR